MIGDVPLCLWVRLALLLSTFPPRADEKVDSRLTKRVEHGAHGDGMGLLPREGKTCLEVAEKGECVCLRFITALHPVCCLYPPVSVNGRILGALCTYLARPGASLLWGHEWLQGLWSICAASSPHNQPHSLSSSHTGLLGHITHTPALAL